MKTHEIPCCETVETAVRRGPKNLSLKPRQRGLGLVPDEQLSHS